jgi:O-antigen/teichoic acid export membrane protein
VPNNREWALIIWAGVALVWMVSQQNIRRSLVSVLRVACHPSILVAFGGMCAYTIAACWIGTQLSLWNAGLATSTALWFAAAMALFWNFNHASEQLHYFRRKFRALVGVSVFVEFVVNLFSFPLLVELVLLPVITVFVLLGVVAALKPEHRIVKQND